MPLLARRSCFQENLVYFDPTNIIFDNKTNIFWGGVTNISAEKGSILLGQQHMDRMNTSQLAENAGICVMETWLNLESEWQSLARKYKPNGFFRRNIGQVTLKIIYFHYLIEILSGSKYTKYILYNFEKGSTEYNV